MSAMDAMLAMLEQCPELWYNDDLRSIAEARLLTYRTDCVLSMNLAYPDHFESMYLNAAGCAAAVLLLHRGQMNLFRVLVAQKLTRMQQ